MVNELIISWSLAALSYDEDNIIDNIKELFPKFKPHFKANNEHKSHFYGVVIDEENKRCFVVSRGTDGDKTLRGNLASWSYNANIIAGPDGVHNGFQKLGNDVINNQEFKNYFYKYNNRVIACGHSQGSGCSQYILCLLAENFPSVKEIKGYVFAAPPSGNQIFANRFKALEESGRISLDRYVTNRDPITSKFLRNTDSLLLNGVDVGNEIILPEMIKYDLKLANVLNHSTAIYNSGLMLLCSNDPKYTLEDLQMLGKVGKKIIN